MPGLRSLGTQQCEILAGQYRRQETLFRESTKSQSPVIEAGAEASVLMLVWTSPAGVGGR